MRPDEQQTRHASMNDDLERTDQLSDRSDVSCRNKRCSRLGLMSPPCSGYRGMNDEGRRPLLAPAAIGRLLLASNQAVIAVDPPTSSILTLSFPPGQLTCTALHNPARRCTPGLSCRQVRNTGVAHWRAVNRSDDISNVSITCVHVDSMWFEAGWRALSDSLVVGLRLATARLHR